MGVKNDVWIREQAARGMIEPFEPGQVRRRDSTLAELSAGAPSSHKVISYGTSSYGYDMRVADEWRIFTNVDNQVVDPKALSEASFVERTADTIIIPPNSFALGRSVERFKIPRDVLCIVFGKSTYARCGIVVNVTPLEPEWEGYVTLEFSNTTPLPAKLYANEGVAQVVFLGADIEMREYVDGDMHNTWSLPTVHNMLGTRHGLIQRRLCETSYGDRGGKYQGQRGVTLPKV